MNCYAPDDRAKQFFEVDWKLLDELSNTASVGEPNRPVTKHHLQLKPSSGNPAASYVGMTPKDHSFPLLLWCPPPAPLEIEWLDDSNVGFDHKPMDKGRH